MRFSSGLLALGLAAVAPAAQGFEFTGPDAEKPLNLSAPVTLTWQHDGTGPAAGYQHLELSWRVLLDGDSGEYGDGIRANISLKTGDGKYDWDATEAANALAQGTEGGIRISDGKEFYFRAHFQSVDNQPGTVSGTSVESEKYSVVGYDHVGSSAAGDVRPWGALTVVMLAAAAVL